MQQKKDTQWYKDAIIYELHIKAFKDGNDDGIGDLEGLLEKLDYLEDLGINTIWLLPFYPSPLRDDGYDIADYYTINPAYGNIDQFRKLLDEAHKRNLRVITELVINHTSDQHPWFQRARNAPKGSPERNYYVWTDDPSQYKDARIIFQDYERSNWTWDPVAQQYYWHRFFYHQPDLNYDNPYVQEEVFKIIDHWCNIGVDGFRLDAVPYLFERDGTNCENLPETHAFLKRLRKHVDEKYPGTLLLAEANMWPEDSAAYFGNGDECHMNYHFPVMPRMFMSLQMEDRYPIMDIFDQTPEIPENCQWAIFLRNHDELTLEMVTDEERDYMYRVYVKDVKARINLGIRHRLAPLMGNNRKRIELLNYLLFSLPGTPVLYYGDEIGMGDNFYLGDRDGVRTPMQWSGERNAGFSEANPQKLYLPTIIDPQYHYEVVNVELQYQNTSSLLWWTKKVINARKKYKAFGRGDIKFVESDNPKVLAFTRTYGQETILVVVNLSRYAQAVQLRLKHYAGKTPVELFSNNHFPAVSENNDYLLTAGPYECYWFLLQGNTIDLSASLTLLNAPGWEALLENGVRTQLEQEVLSTYLKGMRWFGGKARNIDKIEIVNDIYVPTKGKEQAIILLVEVTYYQGLPEVYQLPVAFAGNDEAKMISEQFPQAIISQMTLKGEKGILYDATFSQDFQQELIQSMAAGTSTGQGQFKLKYTGSEKLSDYVKRNKQINSRILSAQQSNTSVTYDKCYFLKLYRKVDMAINPDIEITRYLTEEAHYKNIPAFAGLIELQTGKGSIVLGMLLEMVNDHIDGWSFMLERLKRFNEKILTERKVVMLDTAVHGSLTDPAVYEDAPEHLQGLIENIVSEKVEMLGVRTGELHVALCHDTDNPDFKREPFSLHYQRALFSSFRTLVRSSFQNLEQHISKLSPDIKKEAEEVLALKDEIYHIFQRIHISKIDAAKTRIHGDYHLGQVLFTGKDLVILDFEGEPAKSYSERRLKRSPLRDVAGMIRSFHYAAYGSLFLDHEIKPSDTAKLVPFAEQWYHYMSGFFVSAYLKTVAGQPFLPTERAHITLLLQTFLLEKAVYELNYELNNRPEWVIIPIRGIKAVVNEVRTENNTKDSTKDGNTPH